LRITIVAALVGIAAVSMTCWWSRAEPKAAELADADAAGIINDLLNQQSYETLLLGNLVVYADTARVAPGNNITAGQYHRYKVWERIGIINIVASFGSREERPQQFFSNDLPYQRAGIVDWITVIPTSKASENGYYFGTTLKIRMATFAADYLARNEERLIGVHTYRILMGTYTSNWTPAFLNFCRADSACAPAQRGKFIVLVKVNDFTQRWNVVAWDIASIDHEFTTHNVDQQLMSLR
jgi:hypothetical protein